MRCDVRGVQDTTGQHLSLPCDPSMHGRMIACASSVLSCFLSQMLCARARVVCTSQSERFLIFLARVGGRASCAVFSAYES